AGTLAPGFLLRDGRVPTTPLGAGLTVVGMVQDHGIVTVGTSSSGIEITVRPTADAIADLVLQNSLVADPVTGTIDIEATGNVYQQAGAGIVSANALVAEAGTLPSSEVGGNVPGSIPSTPLSRASVWLGNINQIGTLANATATQEFLLHNGPGLTVAATGTVLAGAASPLVASAGIPAPIVVHSHPTVEIDVDSGDLVIAFDGASTGVVHAGLNAARAGDVGLAAGGNVLIDGVVFAAGGGTVAVAATGNIDIPGLIWGDGPPNGPAPQPAPPAIQPLPDAVLGSLAAYVTLQAGGNIDEPGAIGTVLLRGAAQGHALLTGAGAPTQNDIVQLGSFDTNLSLNSPVTGAIGPGLLLRNERTLTAIEPVTDHGSVVAGAGSSGISIAVASDGTLVGNYGSADLLLQSTVTANANTGTVTLQASGNVLEQAGGTVVANTLIAQAGAIPDTEPVPQANHPGSVPASPVALGSALFGNANTLAVLGNVTATQDFLLNNARNPVDLTDANLTVAGTVLAGAAPPPSPGAASIPKAEIDVLSAVSGTSNISIAAGATIDAGFILSSYPDGNAVLHAGDAANPGAIDIAAFGTVLAVPDTLVRPLPSTSGVALLTA
ncbi:MAG TPA: hypothetical protein VLI93_05375, partial [Acetobacteraceae bacterium]|nr:hypothetical protein [Acetobacteraceae bacterium]